MAENAKVAKALEEAEGRKAKPKSVSAAPEGTKEQALPAPVKKALEEKFGADLSKVRVHTGGNVPELAKELKAKAFTIGSDVFVANPSDAKSGEFLAHELAHVIQQGSGRLPKEKDGKALVSR